MSAGSLRSVQLPLDHQVEKRDRAACHRCSNDRRACACMMGPSDVVYVEKRRGQEPNPEELQ